MRPDEVTPPADELQSPATGAGPLLQRDYWAVIREPRCRPSQVMEMVATRFCELPPSEVVSFTRPDADGAKPVEVGERFEIRIKLAGDARVRVIHTAPCSVTLGTLVGHPEAGRITFGSYRNDAGDVIFHIRSRARSSSILNYCGFLVGGDPMQTESWTVFVNNVAAACGNGVEGEVHAETRVVPKEEWEPADESMDGPTFVALAD